MSHVLLRSFSGGETVGLLGDRSLLDELILVQDVKDRGVGLEDADGDLLPDFALVVDAGHVGERAVFVEVVAVLDLDQRVVIVFVGVLHAGDSGSAGADIRGVRELLKAGVVEEFVDLQLLDLGSGELGVILVRCGQEVVGAVLQHVGDGGRLAFQFDVQREHLLVISVLDEGDGSLRFRSGLEGVSLAEDEVDVRFHQSAFERGRDLVVRLLDVALVFAAGREADSKHEDREDDGDILFHVLHKYRLLRKRFL